MPCLRFCWKRIGEWIYCLKSDLIVGISHSRIKYKPFKGNFIFLQHYILRCISWGLPLKKKIKQIQHVSVTLPSCINWSTSNRKQSLLEELFLPEVTCLWLHPIFLFFPEVLFYLMPLCLAMPQGRSHAFDSLLILLLTQCVMNLFFFQELCIHRLVLSLNISATTTSHLHSKPSNSSLQWMLCFTVFIISGC